MKQLDYLENTVVELKDGRHGLIVEVRANGNTQYDIELADGEMTTVFHEEVLQKVTKRKK